MTSIVATRSLAAKDSLVTNIELIWQPNVGTNLRVTYKEYIALSFQRLSLLIVNYFQILMFISPLLIVKYDDAVKEMWCKDTKPIEGRNGCMSDKQCLENARGQCDKNPTCFGVSWFPHIKHQKLKLCTSREMVPKRRPFLWRTMMKIEGNCLLMSGSLSYKIYVEQLFSHENFTGH